MTAPRPNVRRLAPDLYAIERQAAGIEPEELSPPAVWTIAAAAVACWIVLLLTLTVVVYVVGAWIARGWA